ncbi:hypothetical protein QZN06_27245, partial [Burkholderia multivorans]|nr:hypothetical protein [Burkholderia multivorans]
SSSPRPEVLCDRAIATPDVLKVPSGYAIDLKLSTVFCDEPFFFCAADARRRRFFEQSARSTRFTGRSAISMSGRPYGASLDWPEGRVKRIRRH